MLKVSASNSTNHPSNTQDDVLRINGHVIPNYEIRSLSGSQSEPPPSYEEAIRDPRPAIDSSGPRPRVSLSMSPVGSPGTLASQSHSRPPVPPPIPTPHQGYNYSFPSNSFGGGPSNLGFRLPGSYTRPDSPYQQRRSRRREESLGNPVSPNTPWKYSRGYHCYKCQNTGIKLKNGLQCQDCWGMFASRSRHVSRITSIPRNALRSSSGPLYFKPGDPALGGIVCGRCRGSGQLDLFFVEDVCPVCGGVGRVNFTP